MTLYLAKRRKIDAHHSVDRISQLPEPLLHHILSFLPVKDATRTSCLSKTWNDVWNSSPGLEFDQSEFEQGRRFKSYKARVQEFCDHVDRSIMRSSQSNIPIQRFRLCLNVKGPRDMVPLKYVHKWLDYAASTKLDQLIFHCYDRRRSDQRGLSAKNEQLWPLPLPDSFFSVNSFKELDLFGCRIKVTTNATQLSLRKLRLTHVHVDQQTIQGLFSRCRLLEQVSIRECKGFSRVTISGLKLEKAKLRLNRNQSQIIHVESPNVEEITYSGEYADLRKSIASCSCNNLKRVILVNATFMRELAPYIRSKFPALEDVKLRGLCCS